MSAIDLRAALFLCDQARELLCGVEARLSGAKNKQGEVFGLIASISPRVSPGFVGDPYDFGDSPNQWAWSAYVSLSEMIFEKIKEFADKNKLLTRLPEKKKK